MHERMIKLLNEFAELMKNKTFAIGKQLMDKQSDNHLLWLGLITERHAEVIRGLGSFRLILDRYQDTAIHIQERLRREEQ